MPGTNGACSSNGPGWVSTFFGDLTQAVALDAPVSHVELCRTLDQLGDEPPEHCPVTDVPGATVHLVSVGAWHRHATTRDLRPALELAAREVHRRMATALGATKIPPRTDPFVVPE